MFLGERSQKWSLGKVGNKAVLRGKGFRSGCGAEERGQPLLGFKKGIAHTGGPHLNVECSGKKLLFQSWQAAEEQEPEKDIAWGLARGLWKDGAGEAMGVMMAEISMRTRDGSSREAL